MRARHGTAAIVGLVMGGLWPALLAQGTRSTWDGVYTEAQAKRGAELFDRECAQCHGPSGAGGSMAPALVGPAFSANYDGQTVGDLFDRNRTTMPIGKEGQLSGQQNADITAFMLQVNMFPAGSSELPTQSMPLKQIAYVAERPRGPQQGNRPPGTHQDNTSGKDWITRLERPERIPGLKTDEVVKCLRLRPGDVVADIGAGTGAFTIPFARAVAPSGTALAVDIWPDLIEHIGRKAKTASVANLQTVLAARDDPRLPAQQVDVAFFHDVFHNVNDRQAYLTVLASLLKPDGRIAIIEQEDQLIVPGAGTPQPDGFPPRLTGCRDVSAVAGRRTRQIMAIDSVRLLQPLGSTGSRGCAVAAATRLLEGDDLDESLD